jgi:putative radical SAM enzyme (TIGR03279 family)
VSVHTTNPELRVQMMKNKRSGEVLAYLKRLADGGTKLRGQIVLCSGINDGAELDRTLQDLYTYYPAMDSVSIVPAGLTGHRDKLYPLEPFTPEQCREVIAQVNRFGEKCLAECGQRIFYVSDEFYIKGDLPLPDEAYYEEYTQIENGVGMITSFENEFRSLLKLLDEDERQTESHVSVATGEAAAGMIGRLVEEAKAVCPNLHCQVYTVKNHFFGGHVTVTGLRTGKDLAEALTGKELGEKLLLSRTTLRSEGDLFLCGMTPAELEEQLGVEICFTEQDGGAFLENLLGV